MRANFQTRSRLAKRRGRFQVRRPAGAALFVQTAFRDSQGLALAVPVAQAEFARAALVGGRVLRSARAWELRGGPGPAPRRPPERAMLRGLAGGAVASCIRDRRGRRLAVEVDHEVFDWCCLQAAGDVVVIIGAELPRLLLPGAELRLVRRYARMPPPRRSRRPGQASACG